MASEWGQSSKLGIKLKWNLVKKLKAGRSKSDMTRERRFNCIGDQVFAEIMADDASNTYD